MIGKKKEVCYLIQKQGTDGAETIKQKERLIKQGYLVVTLIEGTQEMEQGLRDIVQNHYCGADNRR